MNLLLCRDVSLDLLNLSVDGRIVSTSQPFEAFGRREFFPAQNKPSWTFRNEGHRDDEQDGEGSVHLIWAD